MITFSIEPIQAAIATYIANALITQLSLATGYSYSYISACRNGYSVLLNNLGGS